MKDPFVVVWSFIWSWASDAAAGIRWYAHHSHHRGYYAPINPRERGLLKHAVCRAYASILPTFSRSARIHNQLRRKGLPPSTKTHKVVMMQTRMMRLIGGSAALAMITAAYAADTRQPVSMPAPMQEHMLANMRDHLAALGEIQAALAVGKYDQAAEIAENRIGMSSLASHGASHMAPHMPKPMQDIGTAMHRSASRFARVTQEADMNNSLPLALDALADLSKQCVACHAGYRLK